MHHFGKRKFLQMIKQAIPELTAVRSLDCKYKAQTFSEWLELEYGNYYYVFYHAKRWGDEKFRYRKSYFNFKTLKQTSPYEIREICIESVFKPKAV